MSEIERELGWDDEISRESDFTIIPEGDYDFTVTGFERGRYDGSEKLPPCNMAIVTLAVTAAGRKHREPQAQTFPAHTLRGTALRVLHGYRSEAQGRTAPHELERRPRRARPLQDNRPQLEGQERRGYAVQRYQEIL